MTAVPGGAGGVSYAKCTTHVGQGTSVSDRAEAATGLAVKRSNDSNDSNDNAPNLKTKASVSLRKGRIERAAVVKPVCTEGG